MTTTQAKQLRAGERVVWMDGDRIGGCITRAHEHAIWIAWDDGNESCVHPADCAHLEREQSLRSA